MTKSPCHNRIMSENAQQGYTATDITALGATIAGVVSIILVATLPYRSAGFGIAAAATAIILALASANAARREKRAAPWPARIGSIAGVAAILMIVVWELARSW